MGHRITIRQPPRSTAAFLFLALLLLSPGCGERPPAPEIGGYLVPDRRGTSIDGRLYSRRPVLLIPGTGWHH